jgi:hypothetical protein
MNYKPSNWNKPTPAKWRNIGDALLVLGLGMNALVMVAPIHNTEVKDWMVFIFGSVAILGKFATKLFGHDEPTETP